jgi:hypothetical protein
MTSLGSGNPTLVENQISTSQDVEKLSGSPLKASQSSPSSGRKTSVTMKRRFDEMSEAFSSPLLGFDIDNL